MFAQNQFSDYVVVGFRILYQNGCFSRVRYWLKDWQHELAKKYSSVYFINGKTGPETEITVEIIRPIAIFDITD